MKLREYLRADILANKDNKKGKYIVVFYRICSYVKKSKNIFVKILGFPLRKIYSWLFYWILGIEIPEDAEIGKGLQVWHGAALIINKNAVLGDYVLLRHSTTIGNKYEGSPTPRIGNYVDIGAHCVLIGDITIGNNVTIGAGTIVTKSIPDNSIAYGNPMIVRTKKIKNIEERSDQE